MSGAQFNIGQQQAGVINNVGGNLNVDRFEGTLQVGNQLVADLRAALDRTPLPGPTRAEAGRALDEVERELERPQPDKSRIAARLEGLTRLLSSAGALAAAADNLLLPVLGKLADWLGPAGASLTALLA
jgi:hypothetical protein